MNFGVLGSGMVGRALSGKLSQLGHDVVLGTRDVDDLLARTEPSMGGRVPPFSEWHEQNQGVKLGTFAEASSGAEIVFNATSGAGTLEALGLAGAGNLDGRILIDVSNPLDYSQGFPPALFVCNTESLAERIQETFPGAKVVKALNTINAEVMIDPRRIADGDHHAFVCGNDPEAKTRVTSLLKDEFGWRHVVDLGDITSARGAEMFLPLWLRLVGALDTHMINVKIVT